MIVVGILFMGSAIVIPATRAIQEASMRDRIAAFNEESDTERSVPSGVSASSEVPAYIQTADSNSATGDGQSDQASSADPAQSGVGGPPQGSNQSDGNTAPLQQGTPTSAGSSDGTEEPNPTAVPTRMAAPEHLSIPAVDIDTEIVEVTSRVVEVDGREVQEWEVASFAASHHDTSANPGEGGNIVVTGHNDWQGEVFRTLEYIETGDDVYITSDDGEFHYQVEEVHMRREIGVPLEERLATGRFMDPMPEERVTLITCWPYGINDHRIIVVAKPV